MKIVDIAADIWQELSSPTDMGIPAIAYWLRNNIGKLNTAIYKQYLVDDSTLEVKCLDPNDSTNTLYEEIGQDEVAILKLMYVLHFYDLQIRKNNISYDTKRAIEVTSDGHTVRLVSPTEIGKALYMFRKGLADELKQWINWYRLARATPRQVTGDDTIEGEYVYGRPAYPRVYPGE